MFRRDGGSAIQKGWGLALLLGCVLSWASIVHGAGQAPESIAPSNFTLDFSAPGVTVYAHTAEEVYVQVIDLSSGAHLAFLHGAIEDPGDGEGIYGGNSPRFKRNFIAAVWESLTGQTSQAVCLVNGQFFRDTIDGKWVDPTELAYPLKIDGVLLSEGYERRRFAGQKRMLEIWSNRAQITAFSWSAMQRSTAPNILVGLDDYAYVRATERLGRTFVGAADNDDDGQAETLLIYSSAAASQSEARATLRAFGARERMMLDGGGSAQLLCGGVGYIAQARPLPQLIATIPASIQEAPPLEENLRRLWQRLCCE